MEQLPRSPHRRRNKHSRWSLPENHAGTWMQRAYNQQRYGAKNLRNTEVSIREALSKLPRENVSLLAKSSNRRRLGWPRTLSPLAAAKPSDGLDQTLRQLQQSELKLPMPRPADAQRQRAGASSTSAPKSPHLALPLHPIIGSTSSSSGSSSASSPLPDTSSSAATLSAHSLLSATDLSPSTLRRTGRLSPLKPMSGSRNSLHLRTPSPQITPAAAAALKQQHLPFVSAVCQLSPKPRPVNPSKPTRNPSPYATRQHQRHKKKRRGARASGALAETEPTAAVGDQAHSALQNSPPQQLSPQPIRLDIPQITIRFATPVPMETTDNQCSFSIPSISIRGATPLPGEETENTKLSEQFFCRAELAEELEELHNDLHHLTSEHH